MNSNCLSLPRVQAILAAARKTRVLVVGDVMLDQFIWGSVARISPEAPVPVVDFQRESFMPGGAANVARNLTAMGVSVELLGAVGQDAPADNLRELLRTQKIGCRGLVASATRRTSLTTRIGAQTQQVVRIDRETRETLAPKLTRRLLASIKTLLPKTDAVIVGDYGKGVVTQDLLNELKPLCRAQGFWLSLDPKPVHNLNIAGFSLMTPNRKEAFALAPPLGVAGDNLFELVDEQDKARAGAGRRRPVGRIFHGQFRFVNPLNGALAGGVDDCLAHQPRQKIAQRDVGQSL